jgi:hypothetical protein
VPGVSIASLRNNGASALDSSSNFNVRQNAKRGFINWRPKSWPSRK